MKKYTNFYENLKEARMRINNTVVMYDGHPHLVLAVSDHKQDGIFRVYLDPFRTDNEAMAIHKYHMPHTWHDEPECTVGHKMDIFLETADGKNSGVIRKMMNSPLFNNFRPFPLGMCNTKGRALYVERKPVRHTHQGLTEEMLDVSALSLSLGDNSKKSLSFGGRQSVPFLNTDFCNTILGVYPSLEECVDKFRTDSVANDSVAFDRNFALVKGPLGVVYLAYKNELVGFLPTLDSREVRLGRNTHLRELVEALNYFHTIN